MQFGATTERVTDGASICQIGPIIRLLRITTPAD